MSTETKEQEQEQDFNLDGYEGLMETDKFFEIDDDTFDKDDEENGFEGFDGVEDSNEEQENEFEETKDEQEDSAIDFEASENEEEKTEEELDLEALNKKLGTKFKNEEELKSLLSEKENEDKVNKDEEELEKAELNISYYEDVLKLSNEDLMRKQYEAVAVQNGEKIEDEDVQYDIEEKIQKLQDSMTLELHAKNLRNEINEKILNPAKKTKEEVTFRKAQEAEQKIIQNKKALQDAFVEISNTDNFYGLGKLSKKDIVDSYKESDKFLELLNTDKKALAEVTMMYKRKQDIYKKASGKTYGEGMKDLLDEFKKSVDKNPISKAQRKGSSAGSDSSGELLADILYQKPVKNK